jgi:hypothetical protein
MISFEGGGSGYSYVFNKAAKDEASFEEGFTAGIGVRHDFGKFFAKFDYSYSDFGIFSDISKFSLSIGL